MRTCRMGLGIFAISDLGCGMRVAGCRMQDGGSAMQVTGCRMRDAGSAMQVTGCRMRDAGSAMQVTGCRMRDAASALLRAQDGSRAARHVSRIAYHASRVSPLATCIPHPASRNPLRRWCVAMAGFFFAATSLVASNLPLFRFALERWPAENYEVVVFHRGALEGEEQGLVDTLQEAPGKLGANFAVRHVDLLSQMDEPMQSMWNAQHNAQSPWLIVRAPKSTEEAPPVWAGPLKPEAVSALLASPARRKIAERLLRGESAVWVLLECGDTVRDEAAVALLSAELKDLANQLRLPPAAAGDSPLQSPLPLRVAFSLVRVTRNDPAEGFFVNLLLHGEPLSQNKPAAFAVFGRGRTLAPLSGRGLDEWSVQEACTLLVGDCSQEAKDATPGKDLLLAANWNSIFEKPAPVASSSASAPPQSPPAIALDQKSPVPEPTGNTPATARRDLWRKFVRTGGVVIGLLVLSIALLARRVRRKPPLG